MRRLLERLADWLAESTEPPAFDHWPGDTVLVAQTMQDAARVTLDWPELIINRVVINNESGYRSVQGLRVERVYVSPYVRQEGLLEDIHWTLRASLAKTRNSDPELIYLGGR